MYFTFEIQNQVEIARIDPDYAIAALFKYVRKNT